MGPVGQLVLDRLQPDRDQLQRMIGKGPVIKQAFADMLLGKAAEGMDLLLKPVISVPVPATEQLVLPKDPKEFAKFLKDRFGIVYTSPEFDSLLMGKTIAAAPAGSTAVSALQKEANLATMFEHVGENGRVQMGHALWHVGQQMNGPESEPGPLLVNGWANFFFVKVEVAPGQFETRAVIFYWSSGLRYWHAYASPLSNPYRWHVDPQVLSRELL